MKCPECDNGEIVASTSPRHWFVLFECAQCDWAADSLTKLFEQFKEEIIKQIKEEMQS